ncbi:hypothetical protein [Blastopirellula marina]|uniref:Leucine Rich repeats (2 copies) n=1 Tax=Blastopirellula marina TaxID=124 RepID=A0A2S8FXK5_9BACT|nr:hypothetical protein [Blastopirellula marina]PQO36574.1 hypothetical protein C5Y98_11300 [Blastopirellula marina]PTL44404.1 hypothetical protein C5Y97_11310 [Blastopirellula marina]
MSETLDKTFFGIRRRFRFSLRELLIVTFVLSIPLAWLGRSYFRAQEEQAIIDQIENLGGQVYFGYELKTLVNSQSRHEPPGPKWIRTLLGEHIFATVHRIRIPQNQLTDEIVAKLARLRALESISLNSDQVTGKSLGYIRRMPHLESLWLESDKIQPEDLKKLVDFPSLTILGLKGAAASPQHLQQLPPLPRLKTLKISESLATDEHLLPLSRFPQLRHLSLRNVPGVQFNDPTTFSELSLLRILEVFNGELTDQSFRALASASNLDTLRVDKQSLTRQMLAQLNGHPKLRSLSFRQTNINDDDLSALDDLPNLTSLSVVATQVTSAGIDAAKKRFPKLVAN